MDTSPAYIPNSVHISISALSPSELDKFRLHVSEIEKITGMNLHAPGRYFALFSWEVFILATWRAIYPFTVFVAVIQPNVLWICYILTALPCEDLYPWYIFTPVTIRRYYPCSGRRCPSTFLIKKFFIIFSSDSKPTRQAGQDRFISWWVFIVIH